MSEKTWIDVMHLENMLRQCEAKVAELEATIKRLEALEPETINSEPLCSFDVIDYEDFKQALKGED